MRSSNPDRTVHGLAADGSEIARYDRGGKWYVEPAGGGHRRLITVSEAAYMASLGTVYPGKPGGVQFAAAVRRLTEVSQ